MSAEWLLALAPAAAFVATAALTPAARGVAIQLGLVSRARADRWHRRPTPLLGGVAIFVGFAASVLLFSLLLPQDVFLRAVQTGDSGFIARWDGLVWAGVLAFLTGLIDDVRPLSPAWKLAGQLVAASLLLAAGIMLRFTGLYALDAILSAAWFLAITNGLNLLDNMDGLAAGTAAIAALCLAALFVLDGDPVLAGLALVLAGALAGFLVHNYPPARIFMGDSGSLFIGLFLAGLALSPTPGLTRGLFAVVAVPMLILAVPIFDTALVTVTRLIEGRSIARGGRDHSSHRLVALGLPESRAVQMLWALSATGGVVALLFRTRERPFAYLFGGFLILALAVSGVVLVRLSGERAIRTGSGTVMPNPLLTRLAEWHERWPVLHFALDMAGVTLAYYAAYLIRWDPSELPAELAYFRRSLPVVLAAKMVAFAWAKMYSQRWSHFGLEDAGRVVRGNALGSLVAAMVLLLIQRVGLSRGVLIIDFLVCSALTMAARFSQRLVERGTRGWRQAGVPAVVFAAPDDALVALAELSRVERRDLRPVAVVHPNAADTGGTFKGYPRYGGVEGLARALEAERARAVVAVATQGSASLEAARKECHRLAAELYLLHIAIEPAERSPEGNG
ncbi:MAG: hypothetical protein HY704_01760 [Gemmatimonadetes bacterium]|nr:hypothetical protein [Gemmatimonadota bacterium]